MNKIAVDPYVVLGVKPGATPDEIRGAYLALVRQYPPDRDADKFREIHAAYQMLDDPLVQAEALLADARQRPNLSAIAADAERARPRLPTLALLALGNQQ